MDASTRQNKALPPTIMASNNGPQLLRQHATEVADDERAFQGIVLSLSWLLEREICSVSMLNSAFLPAARENYLWQPSLSKLEKMPLHDHVDVSAVDFPTDSDKYDMCLPPRIRGERRARDRWTYTYLPHCRDRAARRHPKGPLVLREKYT